MAIVPQLDNDNFRFITGPQVPIGDNYFDQTFLAKARQHGLALPDVVPADPEAVTIQGTTFNNHFYYDLPLVLYIAYQRTGDPTFLAMARKAADLWWQHPQWIGEGRIRQFPDSATPAPRHAGLGGLMLRALDGRPEMWDWIVAYERASFDTWIKTRLTQPHLHYGLREGAFALQDAARLVKVLPDSFPNAAAIRAQFLADIESACVDYFGRLQLPDGSWRWSTTEDEPRDEDGGTWVGIMQPFMVGLTTRALVDAHQVVTTPSVKENIATQILKACRHLYSDGPYTRAIATNFNVETRGFHYFSCGGTTVNPAKYAKGDIPDPWPTTERWHIASARQAISTILPAFGYAYKISGDPFFKDAGEELWDSAYSGRDGFRAMMDDTAKNFNQHARGVGSYRAWLGGTVIEPPPPPPPPPPDPVLPPSPDGTKAAEVIDNNNGRWWLASDGKAMRNQTHMGGAGKIYKWLGGVVYVLGMDDRWYKWAESAWVLFGNEPGVPPPVEPPPVDPPPVEPPPTPKPTCTITVPEQLALPSNFNGQLTVAVVADASLLPFQVSAVAIDGQVTVTPTSQRVDRPSMLLAFNVRTKKRSSSVRFNSPCGQKVTRIVVR